MTRFGWGFLMVLVIGLGLFFTTLEIRIVEPSASANANAASQAPTPALIRLRSDTAPGAAAPVMPAPGRPTFDPGAVGPMVAELRMMPQLQVPVAGVERSALRSSWGDPRDGGARGHAGTDILAASGTPVIAAAPGRIEKLFVSDGGGGISAYIRSPDRRWTYYYAHMGGYAPGLVEGAQVKAGDMIGYVGDTGNAAPGVHHLHFGVSQMQPQERWHQGTAIDPYPLLAGTAAGG